MKRSALAWIVTFVFIIVPGQVAAITWEAPYSSFQYSVEQGGLFAYPPSGFLHADNRQWFSNDQTYGAAASGSIVEFAGSVPPGEISLNGLAKGPDGGISPPHGLLIQALAEIVPYGLGSDHGVDISQSVISWVTRRFSVTSRPHKVTASLSGVVNFNNFGENSPSLQGTHSIEGSVELVESLDNFGTDFRLIYRATLSESTREINANVNLLTNADYEFKITLNLKSHLVNYGPNGITGILPSAAYKLGSLGSPMVLEAIIFDLSEDVNSDGIPDNEDNCPTIYNPDQADTDGDGFGDICDNCPAVHNPQQQDSDMDDFGDACDDCPQDHLKITPGICGCGVPDIDSDHDGTPDCNDLCPQDFFKIAPGVCGCGVSDRDTDGDGTADCYDLCPNDPVKTAPGICGCGVSDTDSDQDGTPDCNDLCPNDPVKTAPGVCGCGVPDTDSDQDGIPNCNDLCPNDRAKTAPGVCGCGVPDTDSDQDSILDCEDNCPMHYNPNQSDVDSNGVGDACDLGLPDAIIILQVLAGMELPLNDKIIDLNGDDRIGIEEIIYALQHIAGLR